MDRQRVIDKLTTLKTPGKTFEIIKELGRGGNGVAFLCRDGKKEPIVAKIYIPPDKRDLDEKSLERFENEVALTSKLKHPNIVPSLGSGTAIVGAHRLPFYLMPHAAGTLRGEIRNDTDPALIERKFRLFLRAAYGVACLHSQGVVHRDLKPENILIDKSGNPWVADLGIAHINPEFVSVGLKTIECERLLNRDYYAPEQRFGKATAVDRRADIYALGCIFYEMLTSIPPVRTNAPKLSVISTEYRPFEGIWEKMTAWEVEDRYPTLEDAIEDISIVVGWVLATLRGSAGLQHPDLPTMARLIKTSNEAQRQRGIDIALRIGKPALPELHNLLGHARRDVRNSTAVAIGQICDSSSIPFLVGGLYGNATRASQFRPTVETSATALAQYAPDLRLAALKSVKYPIRPNQIQTVLSGINAELAYASVLRLREKGLILVDWSESDLSIFISIDEERAWPEVKAMVGQKMEFKLQNLFPVLNDAKKLDLMFDWIDSSIEYSWHYSWMLDAVLGLNCEGEVKRRLLLSLQTQIEAYGGSFKERGRLLEKLERKL